MDSSTVKKIVKLLGLSLLITFTSQAQKQYVDKPYLQDMAKHYKLNAEHKLNKVLTDRNGYTSVLSEEGLLHPFELALRKDQRYRPLTDTKLIDVALYQDQFVYLSSKAVWSYAWAGKPYFEHHLKNASMFAVGDHFSTVISDGESISLFKDEQLKGTVALSNKVQEIKFHKASKKFLILTSSGLYSLNPDGKSVEKIASGNHFTSFDFNGNNGFIGSKEGLISVDLSAKTQGDLNNKLPYKEITKVKWINNSFWFGSTNGAFKLKENGKFDYYASKRWLLNNTVVDISKGTNNKVHILTTDGLSTIKFKKMTLAEKANHFQKIQRLRHIRYGFSSEARLAIPGDLSSIVYHDTDNDGLWTSMYLAAELFRYGATKSEDAKQNAYEAFEAMERLTEISGIDGFPARTYEIDGYQQSSASEDTTPEGNVWRLAEDKRWRWKTTTSSDESCGHFFVYALFAEIIEDKAWRDRAIHQLKIEMDHIMDNNWYLVTWDGKPTLWGRWHPDYVNSFPINVGDRRLNSTLLLSFLQTTYHFTKDKKYKKAAEKMIRKYGYDENANRPASVIDFVEGELLSDKWNHSDDEMYFLTIPGFVNYSFTEEQKVKHFKASQSHWEIERSEKNPLWNFLYAMTGGTDYDLDESIWWLKEFPMDLVSYKVDNSQRQDLVRIKPNFRHQEYTEVLPRDERPMHLHNRAYQNNGGQDGVREYPPYIYLLPYWAGRYVNAISDTE